MIKNNNECETALNEECTYIYNESTSSSTGGVCVFKNVSNFICDDIKRSSQCADGGDISSLDGMCGIYESQCKTLCSKIDIDYICNNNRSNDCFWYTYCIDKVLYLF
jgi:hypothetical protein